MRIGVFDSGLGGLVILRNLLRNKLRNYDFLYLGDTKNLPYGNKSQKEIYKLAVKSVEYLFKQNCELVIVACNTVSSEALRKLQQEYLPKSKYKDRKILGIIRPTVENVGRVKRVGLIGTNATVKSSAYSHELADIDSKIKLVAEATPLLVPMIESQNLSKLDEVLKHYLKPLVAKDIQALILGCTHYGLIKNRIQRLLPKNIKVIAQEDLLPSKLSIYLAKHSEIKRKLKKNGKIELQVTKNNPLYTKLSKQWFGNKAKLKVVAL
jgi:glutamate racemase